MQIFDLLGWVKRPGNKIVQISIFRLNLVNLVFSYDLSDTKDGLRSERNGFILWGTSAPFDKNSNEQFRASGPSCSYLVAGLLPPGGPEANGVEYLIKMITYIAHLFLI